MKILIEKIPLQSALSHVQLVVERRNTIPILGNVLLEASHDELTLTATDMDISIREQISVKSVDSPGKVTIPAITFYDIIRKLPDGAEVLLNLEGDALKITAGSSKYSLQTLPADEFPVLEENDLDFNFQIEGAVFSRIIDSTKFAISTEETRYYLNGIYIHVVNVGEEPRLRAAATDGHRLARIEQPCPEGAEHIPGVIIPRKAIAELRKLLDDNEDTIYISLSDARIRFKLGDIMLTTKLIDGSFPDYERVIPTNNDRELTLDRSVFSTAVDRVAIIASEKVKVVKLSLSKDQVMVTATNPESGHAEESMAAGYGSAEMDIGFNARYLMDVAAQVEGAQMSMTFADDGSPCIIRDPGADDAIYVLMPMRV